MEGEGGQYMDGDYADAGAVDTPAESLEAGQYPDGDYGDAGTTGSVSPEDAGRERLTEGQVNTTAEERGTLHGDPDAER
jgi:hypothetical protein